MAERTPAGLTRFITGTGRIDDHDGIMRLALAGARRGRYSDSQLDDFHGRSRSGYRWRPPVSMSLRARFSHGAGALRGTAGFGWWNAPFTGERALLPFTAPRALWFFFASAPANLALTGTWPGRGWFAQSLNVPSLLSLGAAFGLLAPRLPRISRFARRAVSVLTRATERPLPDIDLTAWHAYRIEWHSAEARFLVDGDVVMRAPRPPQGPLAAVIWIDNQYASVTGRAGTVDVHAEQWMEIENLALE